MFNDTEMFSYPVELPIEGNRHFLRNIDDPNSDIRPVSYEHTPMQIIADGVPLASGPAIIQEDEQLKDALSLSIDASTQSFSDLISDLKCNEVPIPQKYHDQLLIGEKIDEVNVAVNYSTQIIIKYQGKKGTNRMALQVQVPPPALSLLKLSVSRILQNARRLLTLLFTKQP